MMNYTRKAIKKMQARYEDTDRRIYLLTFDSDILMNRFSNVIPSKTFLTKIIDIPIPQIEIMRIIKNEKVPKEFRKRLQMLILQADVIDGLRTNFERKIPKSTFIEQKWIAGYNE